MAAPCCLANGMAYRSAFLEQSEKSMGPRIYLSWKNDSAGFLSAAASNGSSRRFSSRTTSPGCLVGFAFMAIPRHMRSIGPLEFVLALAHYQYRTRSMTDHAFGGAAQQSVFQSGVAVGRDDNKVCLQGPCRIRDFMEGAALTDESLLHQLGVDGTLPNKRLKLCFARSHELVVLHHERERIGKVGRCHWLHHVQQRELRAELLGERHGVIQSLLGRCRKIGRYQDGFDSEQDGDGSPLCLSA